MLSKLNNHTRDNDISFEERTHTYTIKGKSDYTSVTTWNHSHFPKFNADKIIDKMMKSKNWKNSKYYGKTKHEIKFEWRQNGIESSKAGTKLHYDIECFYNGEPNTNDSVEYAYFNQFYHTFSNLKPFRTEWMVWDEKLKLAGSIDMVFINNDNSLRIFDWKRCKEIKMNNKWQKAITPCIQHLDDCNFNHYSLQLNTYKYLIEKNYGYKVSDMNLVCLHPDHESYQLIEVPDLSKEIKALMKLRTKQLNMNIIISELDKIEKRLDSIFDI